MATVGGLACRLAGRPDWRGTEHFPRQGGYITAVNHNSVFDPFVYGYFQYRTGLPPRFLIKSSLFTRPLVGPLLRAAGQIPVERASSRAAQALDGAREALARGECVAIYPEGTLTRDPDLWPGPGKTGAARLALMTRAPVVPVAQWGAHRVVPPYGLGGRRVRLRPRPTFVVAVGPPVDLSDLYDLEPTAAVLHEASARIMAAITAVLEDIRGERHPGHPGAGGGPRPPPPPRRAPRRPPPPPGGVKTIPTPPNHSEG
ncbi:lysophospholipid acyltransferase family protein, partial [Kitasatospora sp. NPDC059577]|uniref:lysophospholipid acyltransferase family protein n=1 Tax=Kitasatospora sp. NPDC059577 TaxID=3346873 RepID=UPI0036B8B4AE